MTLAHATVSSPVGALTLVASDKGLRAIYFGGRSKLASRPVKNHALLEKTARQLAEYFSGARTAFDVPLDLQGTPFQQKAWAALTKIPYGQTLSYGEQAKRAGNAKAARAIGGANNKNPVSIIVPCHRVIGASGDLVGYGGGLKIKQFLLRLEREYTAKAAQIHKKAA